MNSTYYKGLIRSWRWQILPTLVGRKREEIDVLATHYCNQAGSGTARRARTPRAVLAPVTRIVVPGEKAQKRGQRYGCLGISPSEELCIGKWLLRTRRARSHLFTKDLAAAGVHLNLS